MALGLPLPTLHLAEVVLSECTEANRTALLQWFNDPNAFNWIHTFKHAVVDLEGSNGKVALFLGPTQLSVAQGEPGNEAN